MQKKGANISLKGYDDIFSTDQSRAEAQQERVQEIPLSELHPFEGHPFRVVDDEDMMKTVESVRDFGVLTPAIVRPDPDGGYEIISGHRRRLTARSIIAGIRKYLQHREKVKARKRTRDTAVHGKQSVKQLLGQNQGATNVEIDKDGIRDFERLARKYGVDFAVRKDKSVDPPRYLVFVRSKDADALDAICKEHQARSLTKDKKPSVLAQLKKFKEMVAAIPRKVREKKQERDL